MRVLLAGESWSTTSHHTKGFDTFITSTYEEGADAFLAAVRDEQTTVDFQPNHVAMTSFPWTAAELDEYDLCILSDIGANTLLLPPAVFQQGRHPGNRLATLAQWVAEGGALLMVGGYLSFQGIQAMANYANTPLAAVLPVGMEAGDDREERPEGVRPVVVEGHHPVMAGLDAQWPEILGFQRLIAKPDATVLAEVDGHPLLVVGSHGAGRVAAFASDMAAHWLPQEFLDWEGYGRVFRQLVAWLGERD